MNRNLFHFGTCLPSEAVVSKMEQTATSCSSTPYMVQLLMFSGQACLDDDALPLPNPHLVGVDSRSHPVHNGLCN